MCLEHSPGSLAPAVQAFQSSLAQIAEILANFPLLESLCLSLVHAPALPMFWPMALVSGCFQHPVAFSCGLQALHACLRHLQLAFSPFSWPSGPCLPLLCTIPCCDPTAVTAQRVSARFMGFLLLLCPLEGDSYVGTVRNACLRRTLHSLAPSRVPPWPLRVCHPGPFACATLCAHTLCMPAGYVSSFDSFVLVPLLILCCAPVRRPVAGAALVLASRVFHCFAQ